MPTTQARRTRTALTSAITTQVGHVVATLRSLPPADFDRPSVVADWDVRMIVAHLVMIQDQLLEDLDSPTSQRPVKLSSLGPGWRRQQSWELTEELGTYQSAAQLTNQLQTGLAEVNARCRKPAPETVLAGGVDPLRFSDYLQLLAIDWALHTDDLNRSLPQRPSIQLESPVLAAAVRTLADLLATRHPGRSIEVRIPPYAAVQCGDPGDPTHTRGTPPNVIECPPLIFLRLATGRVGFAAELRANHLTASGTRADLTDKLPLY
ncbi:maleylpyruvate isomerase family mycothiol-dependent enzyme [Granulicoccus phenolivorans]|uniref:maleylpyruvate isomerase family mycothiol-dependent enzyme n=1 Tax=Granulicoccus phenolivorans TaxID=266854 RepID=UPI000766FEE4|nr:maleylpyruvate isomerase family mycothiol-dependent enzyme [Granulicoccus phenolivorans]